MEDPRHQPDFSGWLMYHSVGRFPGQAEIVAGVLHKSALDWFDASDRRWGTAGAQRVRAMQLFGELIGVGHETVFTAENVTQAFATFFLALPPERLRGRKVVIAGDCFPSLHFLATGMAPRLGFELATVPILPGEHYVRDEAFIEAWTDDVALALITWVTSTSSKLADMSRLVAHGRRMGSLIAVDVTQGVGLLPFDATQVDFAASTALKWLCGMPGACFAHVSDNLLPELAPPNRGWFSQPPPLNWDLERFTFAADARRFGNGTPSMLPYTASLPGLEWLTSRPKNQVLAHNRRLSARLFEIADANGLCVATPRREEERGGSVMVAMPSEAEAEALQIGLSSEGLSCDRRGVRVRWSPGTVTTEEALDRMADLVPELLRMSAALGER